LVAAAILLPIRARAPQRSGDTSFVHELAEGWREFSSRTWIWIVVLGFAFANAAQSAAVNVLGPIVARESLGGAKVWGLVLASVGAGLVIGGVFALRLR